MNKFFLISALLALVSGVRAEVITLTPNAAGTGGGLVGGSSTITGTCGSGQFLYNNSGILGCQAGSGGITGPGTTGLNNLVSWNSSTGASIADSGIAASNVPLLNAANNFTASQRITNASQYNGYVINNGTNYIMKLWGNSAGNENGILQLYNNGTQTVQIQASGNGYISNGTNFAIGSTSASYPLDVTGNIRTTTGLLINGSSSGITTINNTYAGTNNYNLSLPAITGNDTFATLGLGQTFSGAQAFSGTAQFSGAGPASGPAANTTWIQGGTTAPTLGSNAGIIAIGGNYAPSALASGQAEISTTVAGGLQLQGYTATSVYSYTGGAIAQFTTNGLSFRYGLYNMTSTHILDSVTAPTTPVNAALTYQNGTAAIVFTATGGTTTISLTMPAANQRWICKFQNETTLTSDVVQTPSGSQTATAIVITNVARSTGTATNFIANDIVSGICRGI